ncbi:hypothetical protein D3C81_1897800 [compost metagenome]
MTNLQANITERSRVMMLADDKRMGCIKTPGEQQACFFYRGDSAHKAHDVRVFA